MEKTLNKVNKTAFHLFDETVGTVLNNHYVSYGLKIALVLYCAFMADKLPSEVAGMLEHSLVRLFIVLCIAYSAHHDPTLAIILSVAFVISVQHLNNMKVNGMNKENFFYDSSKDSAEPSATCHCHMNETEESFTDCPKTEEDSNDVHESFSGSDQTGVSCSSDLFASDNDLGSAQNNSIDNSGENSEVQSFKNQLGPQGVASEPYGHNIDDGASPASF